MAIKSNLTIDQGTDFTATITVANESGTAVNLTDYTGRGQMRKSPFTSAYHAFTVTVSDAEAGEVTLAMNSSTTAAITAGRYLYDIEVVSGGGTVTRIVEGIATVTPEITKS